MINLSRSVDNRWIVQKNISSSEQIEEFLKTISNINNATNQEALISLMRNKGVYKGRHSDSSIVGTMGVRLSQICFYMFGYKDNNRFYPTPATDMYLKGSLDRKDLSLVSLFSMQYPNPYSKTPNSFRVRIGRLFLKLLTDNRINNRLYYDEMVFFLPFIKSVNKETYEDIISSIQEWRMKTYFEKKALFGSVENSNQVFANCLHEFKYYFSRIFTQLGCFRYGYDKLHNGGEEFKFRHGNSNTYRSDYSKKEGGNYICINPEIKEKVDMLLSNFDPFEKPITLEESLSKEDWIMSLYEFEPLKYINAINGKPNNTTLIEKIIYESKYGSNDGKSFEESLKPIFELFRENRSTEIIGGSGDTDLLCVMMDNEESNKSLYKVNIDAKKSKNGLSSIHPIRIRNHLSIHSSKYCIVVSSRFGRGTKIDIKGFDIVTLEAEALAKYCLKECINSSDGMADYTTIDRYIKNNKGTDITPFLNKYTDIKYGVA